MSDAAPMGLEPYHQMPSYPGGPSTSTATPDAAPRLAHEVHARATSRPRPTDPWFDAINHHLKMVEQGRFGFDDPTDPIFRIPAQK